ncbi:hypothetical protein DVH05_024873 [Phytophthora capsici]|nr:hypothetical protein DVH05_024873 [Phytophthora capsici]
MSEETASKVHLTNDDYRIIVGWMEEPEHFEWIHGSSKKPPVGGKPKITKATAFGMLAQHLFEFSANPNKPELTATSMRNRWARYKTKYTKTLKIKESETGMGLTAQESNKGMTISDKINEMCPHFERMDSLFREKPNIQPAATTQLGTVTPQSATDEQESSSPAATEYEFRYEGYSPPRSEDNEERDAVDQKAMGEYESLDETSGGNCEENGEAMGSEVTSNARVSNTAPTTRRRRTNTHSLQQRPRNRHSVILQQESIQVSRNDTVAGTGKPTKQRQTAQESRMSISVAYAKNNEAKLNFFKRKLDQDNRQWKREFKERKMQQDAARRNDLVIALVNQGKSASDIEAYIGIVERAYSARKYIG